MEGNHDLSVDHIIFFCSEGGQWHRSFMRMHAADPARCVRDKQLGSVTELGGASGETGRRRLDRRRGGDAPGGGPAVDGWRCSSERRGVQRRV